MTRRSYYYKRMFYYDTSTCTYFTLHSGSFHALASGGDVRSERVFVRVCFAREDARRKSSRVFGVETRAGHRGCDAPHARRAARRLVRVRHAPFPRRGRARDGRGILLQKPPSPEPGAPDVSSNGVVYSRHPPDAGARVSRACVGFVDGVRPSVGPDRVAVRRVVGAREPRQREERGEEQPACGGAHFTSESDEARFKTKVKSASHRPRRLHTENARASAASTCARRDSSAPQFPARSHHAELVSRRRHPPRPR